MYSTKYSALISQYLSHKYHSPTARKQHQTLEPVPTTLYGPLSVFISAMYHDFCAPTASALLLYCTGTLYGLSQQLTTPVSATKTLPRYLCQHMTVQTPLYSSTATFNSSCMTSINVWFFLGSVLTFYLQNCAPFNAVQTTFNSAVILEVRAPLLIWKSALLVFYLSSTAPKYLSWNLCPQGNSSLLLKIEPLPFLTKTLFWISAKMKSQHFYLPY